MAKKNKRSDGNKANNHLDDWASALARQQTESSTTNTASSKEERIEKRRAKRQKREERKALERTNRRPRKEPNGNDDCVSSKQNSQQRVATIRGSSALLAICSKKVLERVEASKATRSWHKPYLPSQQTGTNNKKKKKLESYLQPRKSDYGGIGLARPSLWISLADPSWKPKLEEEFAEHIAGFFGKQRSKAMKKQLNSDMLWRKIQEEKAQSNKKINGKKLSAMSPDERVEAMLQAGML